MIDAVWEAIRQPNPGMENASYLATVVGLPILIVSYITSLVAENRRREVGTYETLETQYVEFQKLALNFARADVADLPMPEAPDLNEVERAQQRTLYMVLFSLFERAYLMYQTGNWPLGLQGMRRKQWLSWAGYMERYFERESCRAAWFYGGEPRADVRQDFDDRFEHFVLAMMRRRAWVQI